MSIARMKMTNEYYDEFSKRYDHGRFSGYHALLDELEAAAVIPYTDGMRVLEAGCGTGLIMKRLRAANAIVFGADLSSGMLNIATKRGFQVVRADICALPFKDESFDIVYSFKVLAHVKNIARAVEEMARVVRKGGYVFPEFYNRCSFRLLARILKGSRKISSSTTDREVYTRYDSWGDMLSYIPASCQLEGIKGVRIWTLFPALLKIPILKSILATMEKISAEGPLKRFAGFVILKLHRAERAQE